MLHNTGHVIPYHAPGTVGVNKEPPCVRPILSSSGNCFCEVEDFDDMRGMLEVEMPVRIHGLEDKTRDGTVDPKVLHHSTLSTPMSFAPPYIHLHLLLRYLEPKAVFAGKVGAAGQDALRRLGV